MSIQVIVSFCAQHEKLSAFHQLLRDVAHQLPQVAGCEAARVFYDTSDHARVTLVETWASRQHHEAQLARIVASGAWDHVRSHLACEPNLGYYAEL